MTFNEITICLDMYGCPNRCKHCWLGITPNGFMNEDELIFAAESFRPFTDNLKVYNWYREPDYKDNYKEMWELCRKLSSSPESLEHFELMSFWRIVRDNNYVKWLSSLGLKKIQLTIFGGEETTDFYIGRKGAYKEILKAIDILIENRISPRIQVFVNKNNIGELPFIEKLIASLDLEKRCKEFGGEFSLFVHQGSCEGENEQFYDSWMTPEDLEKIPETLVNYTLKHFGAKSISDVFGRTEQSLYKELINDNSTKSYVSGSPVFYIDKNFDVYPNISAPAEFWRLGNLKKDGAEVILKNYAESKSAAQSARLNIPIREIAKSCGNPESLRLFTMDDYIAFLINKYCESI